LHDKDGVGDVSWECYIGMLVGMGVPETGQQLMKTMFPDHERLSYTDFHEWWREFDDNISFEKFDEDGDGELSLNEIKLLLLEMGLDIEGTPYTILTIHCTPYSLYTIHHTLDIEGLQGVVSGFDTDSTGSLSFEEFKPLAAIIRERIRQTQVEAHAGTGIHDHVKMHEKRKRQQGYMKVYDAAACSTDSSIRCSIM
jgi:hypothetical protein